MKVSNKVNVLFICMGNICRSPTAEGVFTRLIRERGFDANIYVESAGTHAYHVGEAPDRRAQQAASKRNVALSHLRARQINSKDFDKFDYLLVMDSDNYANVMAICPQQQVDKVKHFLDYAPHLGRRDVPDPYYGGANGFEQVLDLIEAASAGFIDHLKTSGEIG